MKEHISTRLVLITTEGNGREILEWSVMVKCGKEVVFIAPLISIAKEMLFQEEKASL